MTILGAIRQSLSKMWADQIRYQQIYDEVRRMSRRDLADLGLDKDDAADIALRTVRAERLRAPRPASRSGDVSGLVRA
ncbi:MAG TPA: hypothetical protein VIQ29_21235 [Ancylobacter sp.]